MPRYKSFICFTYFLPKQQLSQPFLKSSEEYCTYMVCNATNSSLSQMSIGLYQRKMMWHKEKYGTTPFLRMMTLVFQMPWVLVTDQRFWSFLMSVWEYIPETNGAKSSTLKTCSALLNTQAYVQPAQSNEINPVDSICPTEFVQQYKQRHRHKMQERIITEDRPMLKSPFSGKDDRISAISSFIFNSLAVSKTKYRCLL